MSPFPGPNNFLCVNMLNILNFLYMKNKTLAIFSPGFSTENVNTSYSFTVKMRIHSSSEISTFLAVAAEDKVMTQNL